MGEGNDELGHVLMKSFIFAVTQLDELPKKMVFYNGGAKLTVEDSPALEDLKSLAEQGVEIMTCGTCLDYYVTQRQACSRDSDEHVQYCGDNAEGGKDHPPVG